MISSERSKRLAEQNGWSLPYAQGNVDGETHRRLGKTLALHARVGIDQYSLGFRAGYFGPRNVDAPVGFSAPATGDGTGHAGAPLPLSALPGGERRFHRMFLSWFR